MHELSIALSILDIVADEAERRGGVRVTAVHLKLGRLAGVVREALLSAFALAREQSAARDCELVIQDVEVAVYCPACDAERDAPSPQEVCCGVCGTPTPRVVRGREMEITGMEFDS